MKRALKIFFILALIIGGLLSIALLTLDYFVGINYFAIDKTYNKSEITNGAQLYSSTQPLLIKPAYHKEYGKGHFPKYKIYNQDHSRLNTYACYESLPVLPEVIKKDRTQIVADETFETEAAKIRTINNTNAENLFVSGKYNMIFYYKNAMNGIQQRQLKNILTGSLGDFKDSLHVVYVNVDQVDY